MTKKNPHWGTTLDEFLDAEGIREAAKAAAVTRLQRPGGARLLVRRQQSRTVEQTDGNRG